VKVVSVREAWLDTTGPTRTLLIGIFSWLAEQERARIVERTVAGMATARRKGKRIGRPRRHVDLDRVREMAAGGMSQRAIATELGVGLATLQRAMTRKGVPKSLTARPKTRSAIETIA
ncbi:MAG: recombinase family protein, partial [Pseudomonadota bacterium]|nr:recombinase family protein [Pseudomonadota bacterium]